jgi:hypothetical protein
MRRRTRTGRIVAAVFAVVLCVLLVKLFGDSIWEIALFFILSLFAGDFIAEWLEKRGWLGRKK